MFKNFEKQHQNDIQLELNKPDQPFVFNKNQDYQGLDLGGLVFDRVKKPDWSKTEDKDLNEPMFELQAGEKHLQKSTGVIIIENDGRIWLCEPKNHFSGYEHTFPKGRIDSNLSEQQSARKEALEETGLLVELTDYLGDYARTVTKTRYYLGKRVGGDPASADSYGQPGDVEEIEAVKLVPQELLTEFLNTEIDKKIADDLIKKLATAKENN